MATKAVFTAKEVHLLLDESLAELEQECLSEDEQQDSEDDQILN